MPSTNLKAARIHAGMTQADVSERLGIPLGTLRRWEQGQNSPDLDTVVVLARLYGVTTDTLLGSKSADMTIDGIELSTTVVDMSRMVRGCDEMELLSLYRALDGRQRRAVLKLLETMQP